MSFAYVFNVITFVVGKLGGAIGLLVLGLATAWLLLTALKKSEYPWPYMLGIYFIFFLFAAVIIWNLSSIMLGAYALGNGIGLLLWGREKQIEAEQPEKPKVPEEPKQPEP
jgi:hypothetical protein